MVAKIVTLSEPCVFLLLPSIDITDTGEPLYLSIEKINESGRDNHLYKLFGITDSEKGFQLTVISV